VREWAEKLASKSPAIMRLGKDAMFRQLDMDFADALDYLRAQLTIALSTEDIVEGVTAFFEKRDPQWKGR
jgi:enoyl-CoA hydratase/carnithine racemase